MNIDQVIDALAPWRAGDERVEIGKLLCVRSPGRFRAIEGVTTIDIRYEPMGWIEIAPLEALARWWSVGEV